MLAAKSRCNKTVEITLTQVAQVPTNSSVQLSIHVPGRFGTIRQFSVS